MNKRVKDALWSVLPGIADEIDVVPVDRQTDVFKARIHVGRTVHTATILWAAEGWPEDVSRVLDRYSTGDKPQSVLVAARRLSPGSVDRIGRLGMGLIDEDGAARIALPSGLAVHTEHRRDAPRRLPAFRWTPAAIAVAEALLTCPDTNVRALHQITGVSMGRISGILAAFDREGFTRKQAEGRTRSGRAIADREALLRSWAPAAGSELRSRWPFTRAERDVLGFFEAEIAPLLGPAGTWAVTGPAAAQLEAPYLTTVPTIHVYVDSDFPGRLRSLERVGGLLPVDEGGRFEFWSATPTTLRLSRPARSQPDSGLTIADLPRVYADLLALGGRYEEAAGHLREMTNLGW